MIQSKQLHRWQSVSPGRNLQRCTICGSEIEVIYKLTRAQVWEPILPNTYCDEDYVLADRVLNTFDIVGRFV